MGMGKLNNPQAAATNWSTRTAASADRYKAGIAAVTVNPMDQAAQAAPAWFAGVQDAAANNRFANSLQGRPITDWSGPAQGKGATNYVTGAQAGKAKYQNFAQQFFPVLSTIVQNIKAMPSGRGANNKARMNAYFDQASQFTYRRGAGG